MADHQGLLQAQGNRPRPVRRARFTIIAAEKIGRHARVVELDPKYVDVAVRRWERYTGKRAVLEGRRKASW